MTLEMRAAQIAMEAWPRAWRGVEVTASVLESGRPADASVHPLGELLLIDATAGTSRVIPSGKAQEFAASPDGSLIAFLQAMDAYRPEPHVPLSFGVSYRYALRVVSTRGDALSEISPGVSRDILSRSLSRSPDGNELAFVGYGEDRTVPSRICAYRPSDGTARLRQRRARSDPCRGHFAHPKHEPNAIQEAIRHASDVEST